MKMVIIPDMQIRKGVPTDHIEACGNYIVEHKPDVIMCLGDNWDMKSLSRFNTNLELEGLKVKDDILAGKMGMQRLVGPIQRYNARAKVNHKPRYKPRMVYCTGNHDAMVRIPRLINDYPILEGWVEDDCKQFLEDIGFEVYDFLEIVTIEGIRFCHYFTNMHSAKKGPLSGNIVTMMKNAGFSFVQGHCQGKKTHSFMLGDGTQRLGIVVGSFYDHEETYEGVQGGNNWHGIIQLNEISRGGGDIVELSLDYLKREYL